MDQAKIGNFLKELRGERALTQEQLAEALGVSRRTVSRWETGSNLPDLDVLLLLSDFYAVELRALLTGERAPDTQEAAAPDEALLTAVACGSETARRLMQRMHYLFLGGLVAAVLYFVLLFTDRADGFLGGLCCGITSGMMIVGALLTSKYAMRLVRAKRAAFQNTRA